VIEQLAKVLSVSADVLYFYARRVPGDVEGDFDEGVIAAAHRAFREALEGRESTTSRSGQNAINHNGASNSQTIRQRRARAQHRPAGRDRSEDGKAKAKSHRKFQWWGI
jgi:hypothetical protein